ncbi:MAG TPA: Rid family detoxifying hydrolase, partial [Chlamydiales bacterium]|nr:Rid family detoxifying hydrolase [Chlamydiales bacterium]
MSKKKIHTSHAPAANGPYSQAILAGDFLFVSGVLPIDPATGKVVEGDIETLTLRIIDSMEAILKEAGLTLEHVVKTDVFLKDLNDFQAMNKAYAKRFQGDRLPARATIQAGKLP